MPTSLRPLLLAALLSLGLGLPTRAAARDPGLLLVYPSDGSPTRVVLRGRFLEAERSRRPSRGAGKLRNVWRTLKSLRSDEIERARLRVVVGGDRVFTVTTDDDGVWDLDTAVRPPLEPGRQPVVVTAIDDHGHPTPPGRGWVYVLSEAPGVAVISDLDDTVVHTGVRHIRTLLKNVLTRNAAQLKAVKGVGRTYRALIEAGARAIFYLSGSPQNFVVRVQDFLRINGLPAGPLRLKNFGADPTFSQGAFKLGHLRRILATHPHTRFLLVGDSGERDPEIYAQLRGEQPRRVVGIVIRRVAGDASPAARFAGMTVVSDFSETKLLVGMLSTNPVE